MRALLLRLLPSLCSARRAAPLTRPPLPALPRPMALPPAGWGGGDGSPAAPEHDGLENVQQKEIFKENEKKTQPREELCAANSVDTLMAEMPFVDTDIEDECAMHATSEINTKKKRKRTTGREIEEGIERKKKKNKQCQPNYFISLPITNPEITVSVQAVQDAIIQKDQRLSKAMVRSGSLHVTMLVMHLSSEEEISTAVGALSDSKVFVEDLLKGKRVDLSFQGIDHFRNQVGFVKLAENTTILTEIAETMRKIFQEKGILAGEERAFKPHLTFMKLSKSTELRKQVKKIDSSLYEDFKNHYFGDEILHRFDLCSMLKKKQPNGYYYCESSIVFVLARQLLNTHVSKKNKSPLVVPCIRTLQTEDKFVSNRFGTTHREERITEERTGEKTPLYLKKKIDMVTSLCGLQIILRRNRRLKIKELETS